MDNGEIGVSSWKDKQKEIIFDKAKEDRKEEIKLKEEVKDFRKVFGFAKVKKKCYNIITKIKIK